MTRDERPAGIGWAYGNNSYGWNYGDLAWYSHAGINGFDPDSYWYVQVDATLTYDAHERMVHEALVTAGSTRLDLERTRTFDGARMVDDRVDMTLLFGADTEAPVASEFGRSLRFVWQGDDLVGRELVDDAAGLLERQTWSYDDAGRWLSHEVSEPSPLAQIYSWDVPPTCEGDACPAAPPELWRRYEREVDEAGRTVLLRERYLGELSGNATVESRWVYDDADRLVVYAHQGAVEGWQYDAEGRLVLETWGAAADEAPASWRETEWDAAGRWVAQRTYYSETLNQTVARTFGCE